MAAKFKKGVDLQGQRGVNAGDGSAATDLVTLQQLQAAQRGTDWKDNVVVATTGNVNLSAPGATIDGVALSAANGGDRVLVKNQTVAADNGLYNWNGAAVPMTRTADADSSAEVTPAMAVTVLQGGTTNRPSGTPTAWTLTNTAAIVLGTTALTFTILGGGSAPYGDGAGLLLSGNTFNVGQGVGIIVNADDVAVDTSVVPRIFQADCAATTNPQTFTHSLGKRPLVQIVDLAANEVVYPDLNISTTTIIVDWGSAPTASAYRVLALG